MNVEIVDTDIWAKDFSSFYFGLFNTPEWVSSISDKNHPPIYLDFIKNGIVVGKMAGLILQGGKIKGNQLHFCSGPALKEMTPENFEACLEALLLFARKNAYSRVSIRPFEQIMGDLVKVKGFFHTETQEFIINYTQTEPIRLSFGFKQNAKKARKAGFIVKKTTSPDMIIQLLRLMDSTRESRVKKYGQFYNPMFLVNLNESTLRSLMESGIGVLYYAEHEGEISSIQINIEKNGQIYGLLMGSNQSAYKSGVSSFIDHTITQIAIENNASYYNLGPVPKKEEGGEGIRRYKESQGAKPVTRFGYYSFYLTFPLILLNPMMKLSKKLPDNVFFNFFRNFSRLLGIS